MVTFITIPFAYFPLSLSNMCCCSDITKDTLYVCITSMYLLHKFFLYISDKCLRFLSLTSDNAYLYIF